jgi:hypothetical protein
MAKQSSVQRMFDAFDRDGGKVIEFGVHQNSRPVSPTAQVSAEWQFAYSYFNERLFGNELPDCVITFTRHTGAQGYFCAEAFRDRSGAVAHEIALNPAFFDKGDAETFATLVHEMVHLKRHLFGRRNRKGGLGEPGYHDVVWAEMMEVVGLMPSDTGKPGGRKTGYHMLDYPIEGGAFDIACRELAISGHTVNWRDARVLAWEAAFPDSDDADASGSEPARPAARPRRTKTRTRFACPGCRTVAYARAAARFACIDCNNTPLVAG